MKPLLCRMGLHKWCLLFENNYEMSIHRCQRAGCHRMKLNLAGELYFYDKVLCSCGAEIVHVRDSFWRRADTGEVCDNNHWHEPAR